MSKASNKTEAAVTNLPVMVICGEDPYLVNSECEKQVNRLLPVDQREMAFSQYDGGEDKINVGDVLDELRTLPFLAERRVVLIKNAKPFLDDNAALLEKYLDNPSPSGVLVMTLAKLDKRKKLTKMLNAAGAIHELAKLWPNQLGGYVADYCRQQFGIKISRSSADLLVEFVGDDPGRLCREADKLAIYIDPRKEILAEDIEQLTGHNRMFNAFGVIDGIAAGQPGEAIGRLRNMFASDKSAEFTVIGAFAYHFRRLFQAKAMLTKGVSGPQVVTKMRLTSSRKAAFMKQVNQFSLYHLSRVMINLAQIDYGIKTGKTTAPVALEQLIVKLGRIQAQRR